MTYKVYKYPLDNVPEQTIKLPLGAEILNVNVQKDRIMLWAKIDADQVVTQERHICIVGTGHNIPALYDKYINSFSTSGYFREILVFHVFMK